MHGALILKEHSLRVAGFSTYKVLGESDGLVDSEVCLNYYFKLVITNVT